MHQAKEGQELTLEEKQFNDNVKFAQDNVIAADQTLKENGIDVRELAMEAGVALKDASILLAAKMFEDAKTLLSDGIQEVTTNPEYAEMLDEMKKQAMAEGQAVV